MISRFLVFIMLLQCFQLSAQSRYKEGMLVNTKGDTLRGFIDYRGWYHNPESIQFKNLAEDQDPKLVTPADITRFSVPGYVSYASFVVSISMNQVDFGALGVMLDTTRVVKAVFLEEILRGDRVTLYSYQDKIKQRFYILTDQQNVPVELMFGKTLRDLQEFEHATYKKQLQTVALQQNVLSEELIRKIETSGYSEGKIKEIIRLMNTRIEERVTQPTKKGRQFGYFVNVGLNRSQLTYTGKSLVTVDRLNAGGSEHFRDEVKTGNVSPVVSGGVDFFPNPVTRRFILRGELSISKIESASTSYSQDNYITTAGTENTYRLSGWNFSFTPQAIYNFYTTRVVNCYLGGGVSFSVRSINENTVEQKRINPSSPGVWVQENYFHFKSSNLSTILRGGLQFYQRLDCSVIWGNPIKYTAANTAGRSIESGLLVVSVGYLMNRSNK